MEYLFWGFALVLVLGVLVFVHELGHFLVAKLFRVRVEVFSLGFGPRLVGFRRGDTDYRVSAVPLGGYVRMAGEFGATEDGHDGPPDPGHFTAKPRWQRLLVMVAGASMNILVALVIWWGAFMQGAPTLDIPAGPPEVEAAEPGSPAAAAGLKAGDRIVAIDGTAITSIEDYEEAILFRPDRRAVYTIQRDGARVPVPVTLLKQPRYGIGWDGVRVRIPIIVTAVQKNSPAEKGGIKPGDRLLEINGRIPTDRESVAKLVQAAGNDVAVTLLRDGRQVAVTVNPDANHKIGIYPNYPMKTVKYGPLEAAGQSVTMAWRQAGILFRTLSALLQRRVGMDVMSGPIEISRMSAEQVRLGLGPTLLFMAFISLQLGIFNLLPIPVLDGGHIVILLIESALRRDVSAVVKERVLQVGFVLLVAFAVVVMFKDIGKQFRPDRPPVTQTK